MTTLDEWRRVSRLGALSRRALIHQRAGRGLYSIRGHEIVQLPGMEYGLVMVDQRNSYLAEETWETLKAEPRSLAQFFRAFCRDDVSDGAKYLSSIDWWQEAQLAYSKLTKTDIILARDKLTMLSERALSLYYAAIDEDAKPLTEAARAEMAERLVDLQVEFDEAEDDLNRLRAVLELTTLAVGDA